MTRKQRRLAERVDQLESISDHDRAGRLDHLDGVPGRAPALSIEEKRELDRTFDVTPPTQVDGGEP